MPIATLLQPQAMPVTLLQIKRHLRLDHATDDEYLEELAMAATQYVEAETRHFLISRTVRQYVDCLPASRSILLQAWPVRQINEVRGYDHDGNPVVFEASNYQLDTRIDPPALIIRTSVNSTAFCNGIEIDMVVGHGETGLDIPSNVTRAILVLIAHWYEFRGATPHGCETAHIPTGIGKLLNPVKRLSL